MAKKKQLAAIIHLGSERVTMQLIEYTDLYAVTILDEASQTVRLAKRPSRRGVSQPRRCGLLLIF